MAKNIDYTKEIAYIWCPELSKSSGKRSPCTLAPRGQSACYLLGGVGSIELA